MILLQNFAIQHFSFKVTPHPFNEMCIFLASFVKPENKTLQKKQFGDG